jgi:DNA polymerase-3 subunit epsilon
LATVKLLSLLLQKDNSGVIEQAIKKSSRELSLPPYLNRKDFDTLPNRPGVYYFHDSKGRILYIGKAINIKKRVAGHFALSSESRSKSNFINEIVSVSFRESGSELIALLIESEEIKKNWPRYNISQRKATVRYGIYEYTDQRNYLRLGLMKVRKAHKPLIAFPSLVEARYYLLKKAREFFLCQKLAGIQGSSHECYDLASNNCNGACIGREPHHQYNLRHRKAVLSFKEESESFIIKGRGRNLSEYSFVIIENGIYAGYGFANRSIPVTNFELIRRCIIPALENEHSQSIIRGFMNNHPEAEIYFFESLNTDSEERQPALNVPYIGDQSLFSVF